MNTYIYGQAHTNMHRECPYLSGLNTIQVKSHNEREFEGTGNVQTLEHPG